MKIIAKNTTDRVLYIDNDSVVLIVISYLETSDDQVVYLNIPEVKDYTAALSLFENIKALENPGSIG